MAAPPRRRSPAAGTAAGIGLVGLATVVMLPFRDALGPATPALALVLPVLVAAAVGGRRAGAVTAAAATVATDVVFVPGYGSLQVEVAADAVSLGVLSASGWPWGPWWRACPTAAGGGGPVLRAGAS